jgi:predicted ABC-type ATPase
MAQPRIYIIAGSNGAGKTTFATRFLPGYAGTVDFINADLIARGLSPFDVERAATAAGRIALERFSELAAARRDFAIETTLSGRAYAARLRRLQAGGYALHLFFLWIPDPALAIQRIRQRVRLGGHNVPPEVVRRRYQRTLENLTRVYWPMVDYGQIIDNSGAEPRPIAEKAGAHVAIFDASLYNVIHGGSGQDKAQTQA